MLYIVGTPIGNLKDITYRAVEVLKEVDLIACEDTRRSLILLNHYGIRKTLFSCHKHNEKASAERVLGVIAEGKSVAFITDAGMPCISDPGLILVQSALSAGVKVEVIGGVTAFTHALVKSGLETSRFCFLGFLPEKKKDKTALLDRYKTLPVTLVFYCAPHNLYDDLAFLYEKLGDRRVSVARELTKLHEEVIAAKLSDYGKDNAQCTMHNAQLKDNVSAGSADGVKPVLTAAPRGEYVLVIEGAEETESPLLSLSPQEHLQHYLDAGMDAKEAVKRTASERGVKKNEIYKFTVK